MIYTDTRIESNMERLKLKIKRLVHRIDTNNDSVAEEEKYIIRFFCETRPTDPLSYGGYKREEGERIELFEDLRTKRERDKLIMSIGRVLRE